MATKECICKNCNKLFIARIDKNGIFCSRKCFGANVTELATKYSNCLWCGESYVLKEKTQKYCSLHCRNISYKSLPKLECTMCYNIFQTKEKGQRFCSKKCKGLSFRNPDALINKKMRRTKYIKICKSCNKEFTCLNTKHQKYCSYKCGGIGRITRIVKICKGCNINYETHLKSKTKFCNRGCYLTYRGNHNKTGVYSKEYIIQKDGKEIILQSSWEYEIALWLDNNNIIWTRPNYISYNDGITDRNYFPDFYLPEFDVYLDPKSPYEIKRQISKLDIVQTLISLIYGGMEYIKERVLRLHKTPSP